MEIKQFNDSSFRELSLANGLVLLIFVAEDCDLCSKLKEQLSNKLSHDVTAYYVDSDEYPELDEKYDIAYNPTLVLLNDNKVILSVMSIPSQIDLLFDKINEIGGNKNDK
jgi:thioredoxin-related protein